MFPYLANPLFYPQQFFILLIVHPPTFSLKNFACSFPISFLICLLSVPSYPSIPSSPYLPYPPLPLIHFLILLFPIASLSSPSLLMLHGFPSSSSLPYPSVIFTRTFLTLFLSLNALPSPLVPPSFPNSYSFLPYFCRSLLLFLIFPIYTSPSLSYLPYPLLPYSSYSYLVNLLLLNPLPDPLAPTSLYFAIVTYYYLLLHLLVLP